MPARFRSRRALSSASAPIRVALLMQAGWPYPAAFVRAGLLCFGVGWVLGYPALRVQHHYLAFVTLAFTTLVFLVLRNEEWLTNGVYGISRHRASDAVRLVDGHSARASISSASASWRVGGGDMVDAALALGPRLCCFARKSDPRAFARPRYPALYADGLRLRLESRRPVRRALCAAGAIHRAELVRRSAFRSICC